MKGTTFFLDQGETLGGAERFLLDFFEHLSAAEIRKINPLVIGAHHPNYRALLNPQVSSEAFAFPSVRGGLGAKLVAVFKLIKAAWTLKKLAKENNARVFFSNTPRTHFVMFLAKTLFWLRGRWIVMVHDFTVPKVLMKQIAGRADAIIANSMPCREYLRERLNEAQYKKIRIIENGIDTDRIHPPAPPASIRKVLLLGRIDPRKGQLFGVEAADLLQERNPDLEFEIVGAPFAGDPRTVYYEQKIKQFVRDRDLKNVRFFGESEDPFEAIIRADCVLFLPTEPETFGRIIIEALALGKLVISFDETGPRETIKQFETFVGKTSLSLLVEKQNAMSLAERIALFADHPHEAEAFTSKGRAFVEKHYNLTETKKRLVNVLLGK